VGSVRRTSSDRLQRSHFRGNLQPTEHRATPRLGLQFAHKRAKAAEWFLTRTNQALEIAAERRQPAPARPRSNAQRNFHARREESLSGLHKKERQMKGGAL